MSMEVSRNHVIMDANQNYHRIAYRVKQGYMPQLTYDGEDGLLGFHTGDDISYVFYALRLLESELKSHSPKDTVFTVTFEGGKTGREAISGDYKANREGRIDDLGKWSLHQLERVLDAAGYNTYSVRGLEADDVAYNLVKQTKNDYNMTYLYTNDADWLINLDRNVTVVRYKAKDSKRIVVTPDNFTQIMSEEYKCHMPYNCILLYKATVGDPADGIKGVPKFGPKAFDKLIDELESDIKVAQESGFRFDKLTNPKNVANVLHFKASTIAKAKGGVVDTEKYQAALDSLALATPKDFVFGEETLPIHRDDFEEKRLDLYKRLGFKSLAKPW